MNDTRASTQLFAALQELAEAAPEMRAGQLMAALGELCADLHGRNLGDATDDELLEAAWRFQRDFGRLPGELSRIVASATRAVALASPGAAG